VLNARIRNAGAPARSDRRDRRPSDLTLHMTISAPGRRRSRASPASKFAEAFKARRTRSFLLGAGTFSRARTVRRYASFVAKAAVDFGVVKGRLERFSVLHTAASAWARSISVWMRGRADRRSRRWRGGVDLLFLLGADESEVGPGPFVVYLGTHGDRGAHRADVILPGPPIRKNPRSM